MANRDNHYEAAFEQYLRSRGIPYVAVDEARRSLLAGSSIKSLDFIVSPPACSAGEAADEAALSASGCPAARGWLVDVKGRRFPAGDQQKQYWKNWCFNDDLLSLGQWQRLFGERFGALFVFAYNIVGDRSPLPSNELYTFRGGLYAFLAIRLDDYARWARPISPSWDTLAMPTAQFRQLARPVDQFLQPPQPTGAAPCATEPAIASSQSALLAAFDGSSSD